MATIFLSYSWQDEELARQLEARLKRNGHSFRIDVGTPPAGKWRARLMKALQNSDVLIPILSQSGLRSSYVASEIGAARVFGETKGMLLLPVIVGIPFSVPPFVSDYYCFRLPLDESKSATDENELDRLAGELDRAVQEHAVAKPPRIFVSHRHKDEVVVRALVNLLESAFQIEKEDVRCTSVQPYTLSPGDRTLSDSGPRFAVPRSCLGYFPQTLQSRSMYLRNLERRGAPTSPPFRSWFVARHSTMCRNP